MKRHVLIVAMVAALAGCAVTRIEDYVKPYIGQDVHKLSAKLGKPTGKREITGNAVYVWSTESEGVLRTDSGAEGTRVNTMTMQYDCTLEVTVDAQDVILSYEVEGSQAGCAAFRRHRIP